VTVEEWERFQADALSTVESGPVIVATPVNEQRLVFVDAVAFMYPFHRVPAETRCAGGECSTLSDTRSQCRGATLGP
jgi:hypothetical protein